MAASTGVFVRDATHVTLVNGGAGASFLVEAFRSGPVTIATCRSSAAGFQHVVLAFVDSAAADAYWTQLTAAMV